MRQEARGKKNKKQINGNVCLADAVVAATGLFTTPEEQTQIPWINSEVAPVSRVNDFDGATEQSGAESDALHRRDGTGQEIPWPVAGACPWTGAEDTDTMQDCTLLRAPGPAARPLVTSETLADLQ